MTALTVKDIERNLPAHGTLVVLGDGTEVVFAKRLIRDCTLCIFGRGNQKTLGTNCSKVCCGIGSNFNGEYIPKMKYLELKLMGEIT